MRGYEGGRWLLAVPTGPEGRCWRIAGADGVPRSHLVPCDRGTSGDSRPEGGDDRSRPGPECPDGLGRIDGGREAQRWYCGASPTPARRAGGRAC